MGSEKTTAIASEGNTYGRMRRRIVVVGWVRRKVQASVLRKNRFSKDRSLRALIQSGIITREQFEKAVDGFSRAPSAFLWLAEVDEAVLAKADRVFAATHGRWPVEDTDFYLNGDYHKICRSLQYDQHYHDSQLPPLPRAERPDPGAPARKPAKADSNEPRGGSIWPFVVVLILGFCSAPILGALIVMFFPTRTTTAGLLCGSLWLLVLLVALAVTLRRRTH